mmetsp:Transcript_63596/g.184464  ORF Transcript_63596/g.184464 Transcript_63596/m.184464 type:complete len:312 (-) Transcript_63596:256-1191(-)
MRSSVCLRTQSVMGRVGSILRCHVLPDAVAAKQKHLVGLVDVQLDDVGLGYYAARLAPQVAEAPGHVQHRAVARFLVDPEVTAVLGDGPTDPDDALRFFRAIWFVVRRQILRLKARPGGKGATTVADMSNRQVLFAMVVHDYRGSGSGIQGRQLSRLMLLRNESRDSRESLLHDFRRRHLAQTGIVQDHLAQIALDIGRHHMTHLAVPVEDTVDGELAAGAHDNPRVLVRTVGLLALYRHGLHAAEMACVRAARAATEGRGPAKAVLAGRQVWRLEHGIANDRAARGHAGRGISRANGRVGPHGILTCFAH